MKNKKLRVFTGIFAAASIFAMTGIMGVSAEEKTDISEKEAMEIAIADAEVDQDEIERLRVQLDYDDGMLIYDVEFYIGNKEYDYEINAYTGDILERDFDIEEDFERSYYRDDVEISEKEALDIAREDAGLEEEEIIRARVKLDYDDRAVKYDVEFYSEDTEYDYEIDANTGEILEMDAEIEDDFWKFSKEERDKDLSIISMDEAVQIILDKVPGAEETNLRVEMERDDGKIIYEGKLFHDSNEYEFEINAETGTIISWEKESVWN